VKVCDKTCIFFFFPIINKYFLMVKRSLLSRCPSYKRTEQNIPELLGTKAVLNRDDKDQNPNPCA
jgi:hypothetical protein